MGLKLEGLDWSPILGMDLTSACFHVEWQEQDLKIRHWSHLVSKLKEKPWRYAIRYGGLANFDLTRLNDRRRHIVRKRQISQISCMGIVEGRLGRILRAKELSFVSRRASYRNIRRN